MENLLSFLNWQWRAPDVLWLIWIPLIWWGLAKLFRHRQQIQYAEKHLWPWVKIEDSSLPWSRVSKTTRPGGFIGQLLIKLWRPGLLLGVSWMCLILAIAGPRSSISMPDDVQRSGVDILLVMDLSRSMKVQDFKPNRFMTARSLMESFVNRLQVNDRVGLMVYAGKPHLVSPLSFDRHFFNHYLRLMRPGILPTQGSQIKPALVFGVNHLQKTAGSAKILLVFTDGEPENFKRQPDPQGLKALADAGVKIILVGVGQSARSPIPDSEHTSGYLHINGLSVTSRLESNRLKQLAGQLNAHYVEASKDAGFIDQLLKEVALEVQQRSVATTHQEWQDHTKPFIASALMLLLLAFYPLRLFRHGLPVIGVMVLVASFQPSPVWAESKIAKQQLAYQAYQQKDYDDAVQLFDELNNYAGWFGAGAAAYNNEDIESAVLYFRQAVFAGETDWQRAQALFNLGNSYFQANLMQQAIEAYQQALVYQPDYENAKHNLKVAQQRQQQQRRGQQQQQDQDGEGQGEGNSSRDDSGAFYGGQRPDQNQSGEGVSGDAPDGEKDGKESVLPDQEDRIEFELTRNQSLSVQDTANAILDQQQRIRRIEAFERNMKQVEDQQVELLIRRFERSEGFQAAQEEKHPIPGVKPW